MLRLRGSVAFRLAIGYGALIVGAMAMISAVLYVGTIGVIDRGIDVKLHTASKQLTDSFETGGAEGLRREIQELLTDNTDQDTEVYLLLGPDGRRIIGNISESGGTVPPDRLTDQAVIRYGRPSISRLLPLGLPNGDTLIVGRDLQDVHEIEQLVLRALLIGGVVAVLLAIGGALLFRRQLEHRLAAIRRTALEIEAGDMSRRIPETDGEDEFTRLNDSINRMLDRIQRLMDGVRDVSNAIAHDLRTPLGRVRGLLDEALLARMPIEQLSDRARAAIRGIDDLILVFDKLLQIAEVESGARRQSFRPVALAEIITTVVELYDAAAEETGVRLTADIAGDAVALGDKDLLAAATANLVDNALKYAGNGATVRVGASRDGDTVSIVVQDDGPGIPANERDKVVTRFYRLDRSRSLPGNGLGLSVVNAISALHGGSLVLADARPGLLARIDLPQFDPTTFLGSDDVAPVGIGVDGAP